jgi:hypothetical protein
VQGEHFYFVYADRLGFNSHDNDIAYNAGPFALKICGYSKTIIITYVDAKWDELLPHFLWTASFAWGVEVDAFTKTSDRTYTLNYDLNIISLYLETLIEYIPKKD